MKWVALTWAAIGAIIWVLNSGQSTQVVGIMTATGLCVAVYGFYRTMKARYAGLPINNRGN